MGAVLRLSRAELFPRGALPLKAVDILLREPRGPMSCESAKLVFAMAGNAVVDTDDGSLTLRNGHLLVLGSESWHSILPRGQFRGTEIYVDERFLRMQASWLFPSDATVPSEFHPRTWDGRTLTVDLGTEFVSELESVLRELASVALVEPDQSAARRTSLFLEILGSLVPALFASPPIEALHPRSANAGVPLGSGRYDGSIRSEVRAAARLIRGDMAKDWTLRELAAQVGLSPSQLVRLFNAEVGVSPMAYLVQVRLAEFRRLLEETDLPIQIAARAVGWTDQRVASRWFVRRWQLLPREFRQRIHGKRR